MANTYSQVYIHVVFATKHRSASLAKEWRTDVWKYIAGILKNEKCKVLAVNGRNDHVHLFFGMPMDRGIAQVVQIVKANSSRCINENRWAKQKFEWQSGYGAFSYSKSLRSTVIRYVENQEHKHAKRSFKSEYLEMLVKFEVEYDPKYLFDFLDDRDAASYFNPEGVKHDRPSSGMARTASANYRYNRRISISA